MNIQPQPFSRLLNKYDWIISLEVAEHIPAQFESIYIDNLVKHAKEGIILSWAYYLFPFFYIF